MTRKKKQKTLVRERMKKTGETYQSALRLVTAKVQEQEPVAITVIEPLPVPRPVDRGDEVVPARPYVPLVVRLGTATYALEEGVPLRVGRTSDCRIRLDQDAQVSRHHASFVRRDRTVMVVDEDSRNGVRVNGGRIVKRAVLRNGDRIEIGKTLFSVEGDLDAAPSSQAPRPLEVGWLVANRFRIESVVELADGRSVTAPETSWCVRRFVARDTVLDEPVALEVVTSNMIKERPDLRVAALAEVKTLRRIAHPNVLAVLDVGDTAEKDFYVAFEPLRGESLANRFRDSRAGEKNAFAIAARIAETLQFVHARGVVLGSLHSQRIRVDDALHVTIAGAPSADGSTPFQAPEQQRGEPIDARTDLYALGVVLFLLLEKRFPGDENDVRRHPICVRLLAPDPNDRYPDATALLAALREN